MRFLIIILLIELIYTSSKDQQSTKLQDDGAESGCKWGTSHFHALKTNPDGSFVVYKFPDQPDIVMDGLCHDDQTEDVVKPGVPGLHHRQEYKKSPPYDHN